MPPIPPFMPPVTFLMSVRLFRPNPLASVSTVSKALESFNARPADLTLAILDSYTRTFLIADIAITMTM